MECSIFDCNQTNHSSPFRNNGTCLVIICRKIHRAKMNIMVITQFLFVITQNQSETQFRFTFDIGISAEQFYAGCFCRLMKGRVSVISTAQRESAQSHTERIFDVRMFRPYKRGIACNWHLILMVRCKSWYALCFSPHLHIQLVIRC